MLPKKYNDEEFRHDFYEIAMEETRRVNNLITELLDLVKQRESHFELSDLHSLIDKMVLLVSPQSKAKKIDISSKFDADMGQIWLDAEKMKQVILNILSNAIDWTPERGKIEIVTHRKLDREGNGRIQIEIKDNGIGIPETNIERIFDPYFTTRHRSDMHNGTGLGLFIAYQNIQAHRGTIEVQSTPNEGTNFILILPSDKKPAQEEEDSIINR
jgi:two-component system phosphate regulon sensor histidine kinase PhoR